VAGVIYGIGIDLVRISRIDAAIDRHGRRFAERILSEHELTQYEAREGRGWAQQEARADESRDGRGRAKQEARADESRDGRGRAKQEARAEGEAGRPSRRHELTMGWPV
jgi:hypothetical protein